MSAAGQSEAMFKIGEVCRIAELPDYVVRFWQTEFPMLSPAKSVGGQRRYSQAQVDVVLRIKALLYSEGFTIAGARKKLEEELSGNVPAGSIVSAATDVNSPSAAIHLDGAKNLLGEAREETRRILGLLDTDAV